MVAMFGGFLGIGAAVVAFYPLFSWLDRVGWPRAGTWSEALFCLVVMGGGFAACDPRLRLF
jgi:hypothetical protein